MGARKIEKEQSKSPLSENQKRKIKCDTKASSPKASPKISPPKSPRNTTWKQAGDSSALHVSFVHISPINELAKKYGPHLHVAHTYRFCITQSQPTPDLQ
jgi:hypothetical protein